MLPTFLGIGAQRAGTTWLAECLRAHPEVFLPAEKELHFFTGRSGETVGRYESRFAVAAGDPAVRAVGEITPSYMRDAATLDRIAATLPGARLIVMLREPVSRACSAYELTKDAWFDGRPFDAVCTAESQLVTDGRYASQLLAIFDRFPRERVGVFLYDDVRHDKAGLLQRVFAFLGVDPGFRPPAMERRVNRVIFPAAQRRLRAVGLGPAVERVKATAIGEWVRRAHARRGGRVGRGDGGAAARHATYWPLFADDVTEVERLLGVDLTAWRPAVGNEGVDGRRAAA